MESRRWVVAVTVAAMVASAVDGRALRTTVPSADGHVPNAAAAAAGRLLPWLPKNPFARRLPSDAGGDDRREQPGASPRPFVGNGGNDDRGQRPKPTAAYAATVRPKLETTTHDRSIITAPLKMCPDGQRMNSDRVCRPTFVDPEEEDE